MSKQTKQTTELELMPLERLAEAAECMRVMAHPVRLRVVDILMQGRYAVHELAELCELPPHQMSEHLRLLQGRGLLSAQRQGRTIYYALASERLPMFLNCIRKGCGGIKSEPSDVEREESDGSSPQ